MFSYFFSVCCSSERSEIRIKIGWIKLYFNNLLVVLSARRQLAFCYFTKLNDDLLCSTFNYAVKMCANCGFNIQRILINWSSHSSFPGHLVPWLVPANYSSLKRFNTFTFPPRYTTCHKPRLHHSNSPSIIPSSEQHQLAVWPLELATNLRKDVTN